MPEGFISNYGRHLLLIRQTLLVTKASLYYSCNPFGSSGFPLCRNSTPEFKGGCATIAFSIFPLTT